VYQVLGYYLKYRTELGEYLKKRALEEDTLLAGTAVQDVNPEPEC